MLNFVCKQKQENRLLTTKLCQIFIFCGISKGEEFILKNTDSFEPKLEDINSKLSSFSKNTSFWGNVENVEHDEDVLELAVEMEEF